MAAEGRSLLKHLIDRVAAPITALFLSRKTVDETVPDYAWWDRFRHGMQRNYELAGVAAKTINEIITDWVLGKGIDAELTPVTDSRMSGKVDYTNGIIRRFMTVMQSFFHTVHEDYLGLGDQFVAVNPDGTLRAIPPNTVRLITDDLDPLKIIGVEVTTVTDKATIIETFTAATRTRRVARYNQSPPSNLQTLLNSVNTYGVPTIDPAVIANASTEVFPNLIGRIPIVKFSNNQGTNELRGHPFVEDLRHTFKEFDELMDKSMQGAKVSGNPLPVLEGLENPKQTIDINSEEIIDDTEDAFRSAHVTDNRPVKKKAIVWDALSALVLGKGGSFKFASPPVGFSGDTIAMLKFFREHIRDAAHTPNYTYGGDATINPNNTEQTPAWVKFIDGRRDKFCGQAYDDKLGFEAQGGLYELIHIFLLTKRLTDPRILVAPVNILWQSLTEDDEKITFEKIKWADSRGYLTGQRALRLLDLVEGDEVDEEYETAQAQLEEKAAMLLPTTDFGGTGNDVKNPPPTKDNTPDLRKGAGADTPRMPSYAGGGASVKGA